MDIELQEVKKWIDDNSTPITAKEARQFLYGKRPAKQFKIVQGAEVKLSEMMMKQHIKADDLERASVSELLKMVDKPKMKLPLFSFCIDGKVTACVLDIEDGTSLEEVQKSLCGFAYIAYFSSSSTTEQPRLRVVLPMSEPVPEDEYSYCKKRMHEAFAKICDIHSFESGRYFFMPSLKTGQYQEENEIVQQQGASLDFYATTKFTPIDRMNMTLDKMKKSEAVQMDVEDDERVQYYLSTDFPLMRGNGDSASSLYTAICVCLWHDDYDTLEQVLDKARSENWSEKELERKMKDAKKRVEAKRK